jgi:hypothetical protein
MDIAGSDKKIRFSFGTISRRSETVSLFQGDWNAPTV